MLVLAYLFIIVGFFTFVAGWSGMERAEIRKRIFGRDVTEYQQDRRIPVTMLSWYKEQLKIASHDYSKNQKVLIVGTILTLIGFVFAGLGL